MLVHFPFLGPLGLVSPATVVAVAFIWVLSVIPILQWSPPSSRTLLEVNCSSAQTRTVPHVPGPLVEDMKRDRIR